MYDQLCEMVITRSQSQYNETNNLVNEPITIGVSTEKKEYFANLHDKIDTMLNSETCNEKIHHCIDIYTLLCERVDWIVDNNRLLSTTINQVSKLYTDLVNAFLKDKCDEQLLKECVNVFTKYIALVKDCQMKQMVHFDIFME